MPSRVSIREKPSLGLFMKTASHQVIEVISQSQPDFFIVDAEHAPFDKSDLDRMLLASKVNDVATYVRVADHSESYIGACLDMGAKGVVVPHVSSAEIARNVVASTRFISGRRGFSTSPRAGQYGAVSAQDYISRSDDQVEVWCQIEDQQGLKQVEEIAKTPGVDCLFIGRVDLSVSLSCSSMEDPVLLNAVDKIVTAGRQNNIAVAAFVSDINEIPALQEAGVMIFIAGSDQSLLRTGMANLRTEFNNKISLRSE